MEIQMKNGTEDLSFWACIDAIDSPLQDTLRFQFSYFTQVLSVTGVSNFRSLGCKSN